MDSLCSLFDAAACVGELLGRAGEKGQELSTLAAAVESVSQSVRTFASDLAPEARDAVFHSNQVFPQLARHLGQCKEVISGHRSTDGSGEQRGQVEDAAILDTPVLSALKHGVLSSTRTLHEGLEVLGGRLGGIGTGLLGLPEDKLAVIRQASTELARLVPQLHLAISVYTMRGQKRGVSDTWVTSPGRPPKAPCYDGAPPDGRGLPGAEKDALAGGADDVPMLVLQLVSDSPLAPTDTLHALTTRELRPVMATSTSSLESARDCEVSTRRRIFGRQELRSKIPPTFTLPVKPGESPQPLSRYVSRDVFVLDAQAPPPQAAESDSLDCATLDFGATADTALTLSWGSDGTPPPEGPAGSTLATVSALSSAGFHVRAAGGGRWRWTAKDCKVEICDGDRIALLLESPPGSFAPGEARDLGAGEATCLLGVELRRPPGPGAGAVGTVGAAAGAA